MPGNSKLPPLPSRAEVMQELQKLISGRRSRGDVADWAQKWVIDDSTGREYPLPDEAVWEMLKQLMAADLKDSPASYLYDKEDFVTWLQELECSPGLSKGP